GGVDADRRARLLVDAADRAHDALHVLGQPGGVDGALEDPGLDAAALDAFGEVGAHQRVERLVAVEQRARPGEVPRARQDVVRVQARRQDDVQAAALARAPDELQRAPEADRAQLDERVDARLL